MENTEMESKHHEEKQHARHGDGLEDMMGVEDVPNNTGFGAMKEEKVMAASEREIWLERQQDDLLDINDSSIFYNDFPPLPDFPCMSSSSSSSSNPAPAKTIASSSSSSTASTSSSAASWAVLKSEAEEDVEKKNHYNQVDAPPTALSSTASMEALLQPPDDAIGDVDCMDVMENFGYMDLIDSNDIWDPASIFQSENPQEFHQPQQEESHQDHSQQYHHQENDENFMNRQRPSDELGIMFFEWLKSNKEHISAADMRSIKLRRDTVESASKRLGGTKEGKKQLLKLILEWVEQYQLQKKRLGEAAAASQMPCQYQESFQNPNPNTNLSYNSLPPDVNTCFLPSPWMPPQPYVTDPAAVMAAASPAFSTMAVYAGDPYSGGAPVPNYPPSTEYQMLESAQTWPPSQYGMASQYNPFPENNNGIPTATPHPQAFAGYGNPYPYPYYQGGEKLGRLGSSATKEARKKRMARQRRFLSHHRHNRHHNHQNLHQNQSADQQARLDGENCANAAQANPANWVHWPAAAAAAAVPASSAAPVMPVDAPQPLTVATDRQPVQLPNYPQRQVSSDRRQGRISENYLKFLLQKVLKQSDVGNLGRIVLPKKEAETHLPELEARDGIPIAMEDIGTSRVWNMRYRFWPNNKSRMYLLENTGDFVRANGLQEGDFIVIYSDVKCGKYLIRGVKVRQPGAKSEAKKPAKCHRNLRTASPGGGTAGGSSSH